MMAKKFDPSILLSTIKGMKFSSRMNYKNCWKSLFVHVSEYLLILCCSFLKSIKIIFIIINFFNYIY